MGRKYKSYFGRNATIASIVVAMVVVSSCFYVLFSSRSVLQSVAGEVQLSVMIRDDSGIDPASTAQSIETIAGVRSVHYIDSTVGQHDFSTALGVDITSILGVGAIPSSYVVAVSTEGGRRAIDKIKSELASAQYVESVSYEPSIVDGVEQLNASAERFANLFASTIVALVVMMLYFVSRLSVGVVCNALPDAPSRYLSKMLLRRAVVDGVVAGVISAVVLAIGVYAIRSTYTTLDLSFDQLPLIASAVLVAGVVANVLFTYISALNISKK